jgi:C-terminal processing protease CtpA/Prc
MSTVLVDSEAVSEAEVFALVVQLEKRGIVSGDQTSGRIMVTVPFFRQGFLAGSARVAPRPAGDMLEYGEMASTGAVIMKDGKNLDGTGVMPDLKLLPTPEDLAAGRDPALSTAISLAGHKIDLQQAGELLTRN